MTRDQPSTARLDYESPVPFTWKQRVILATAPWAIASVLKILYKSASIEVRGEDKARALDSGQHYLLAFWHETLGLMACRFWGAGHHTLTSYSFDGELAARVVKQFGLGALRGSSSRGGTKALAQLRLATESVRVIGLTLDGPRGPRRVAKLGLAYLSARTGLPVVAIAAVADPAWRFRSWDRLQMPKPGATIRYAFSEPIPAPTTVDRAAIEAMRARIETRLNELHAELGDSL